MLHHIAPLPAYLGWALVYAAAGTAILAAAGHMVGARLATRALPTIFSVLFFLALAFHPLPDSKLIVCPVPGTEPNWVPLTGAVWREIERWGREESFATWVTGADLLALVMNLVLCILIGALLGRHRLSLHVVVLLSFGLSLTVELTQLTGIWGFYPCAYRQFDVNDLILNTLGVALGFWATRRWAKHPSIVNT